jgi:endonuclease/exonuclease/phosphatase family metal-dependent hydrolase
VQLKVVSYNVLMDANPELSQYPIDDLLHTEERWPALLRILEQERADVIALQEGTPAFHKRLLAEEWVRRGYHISDCSGNSVKPMGNLLLSRYPFASVGMHTTTTALHPTSLSDAADLTATGQRNGCTGRIMACPSRFC